MSKIIKFYESGYNPNQLIIQWNMGNTCNYACEYCPSILHSGTRPWVELSLIKDTILKIQNHFPYKKIKLEFLGGETTLYKDFLNLMKFCKDNNFSNMIFSNASRTVRFWNEVAPYLDKVLLTYHPHTTKKTHFKKIIDICYSNNVNLFIHLAMTDIHFQDTIKFNDTLNTLYPSVPTSLTLMMDKENKKDFNGYFYNYSQDQLSSMRKYKQSETYVAEYDDGKITTYTLNEVKTLELNKFKNFNCGTSPSFVSIDALGNASSSICRQKSYINIYDNDIELLFQDHYCRSDYCKNPADMRILKINQ